MRKTMRVVLGAVAAFGLATAVGCQENREAEGLGGAGMEEQQQENNTFGTEQNEPNLGDSQMGDEPGVFNDGEGPIEGNNAEPNIGENEGVINDGEGPIEDNTNLDMEENR